MHLGCVLVCTEVWCPIPCRGGPPSDPMKCGPMVVLYGSGVGVWGDVDGILTFARASSSLFSLNPFFGPVPKGEQPEVCCHII